jgi:calcium-dependent protein kinase
MIRVIKVIPLESIKKEDERIMLNETSIMIQLDHANIVKLFEVFKDE